MINKDDFGALVNRYLEYLDVKIQTKRIYREILQAFTTHVMTLSDLPTRSDVMAYRESLKAREFRASTIQLHVVVIRNFYRWFHIEGYGPNAAEGVKGMKMDYEGTAGKIMNDKMEDNTFYLFLFQAFDNMFKASKPGGAIYVCHADTEGINFRNAFKNAGFKLAECLVWVKNALVLGRQDYHWRHEPILYGWKEGSAHYFVEDRTQDTIWEYNKPKRNEEHPTMKPLELVGRAISNSSRVNETVLDLFGGSGSTMIASDQLQRRALLMELDERYVDVIVKRYLRHKNSFENCFLVRNGIEIPLDTIEAFQILSL